VRDEPRHHNVFENEYVRILDVHLAPHDTTQYHVHNTPSVFIVFTKTITGSQLLGQTPVMGQLLGRNSATEPGYPTYDSLVIPRIHRVWNDDSTWFHVMDIELVAGKAHNDEPLLQNSSIQLMFDKPLVRGYKIQLATKGSLQLPLSKTGYLLVSLSEAVITFQSNGTLEHRYMKAGHYCWIEAGWQLSITNNNAIATFALLQLK
jgi:hypothetical protein